MSELIVAVCGLGVGLSVMLVTLGIVGRDPDETAPFRGKSSRSRLSPRERREQRLRWLGAAAAGAVAWVLTGWPVAGLAIGALVAYLPWLFSAGKVAAKRIERLEAIEDWLRNLTDIISSGNAGLVAALQSSARGTAPAISQEVATLAQRTRSVDVESALLSFADDVDDEVGDAAAAGLCVAYQQGSGVAELLRRLARKVSNEVTARRQAETERARRRTTARVLMGIWAAIFIGFATVSASTYTAVYDTFVGQLVLAVVLGMVALSAAWLRQLGIEPASPRFLVSKDGKAAT